VRALFVAQAVLLGAFVLTPMPLDADQYAYVAYADLANLGYSPYDPPRTRAALPRQLRDVATVWSNNEGAPDARARVVIRDKYGPALTMLMAAAVRPWRGASLETQARVLRLLAAIVAFAIALVLWDQLRDRRWGAAALAAFALNPLVITQTGIGAHDDLFAVLPALAAYACARRTRMFAAAACLGLSVACKLTFAPFALPLLAFCLVRTRSVARTLAAAVVLIAVPLVFALPFGWFAALVRPYQDARAYNASLLFAYAGAAVARLSGSPQLVALVRGLTAPVLIVLCSVAIAVLVLRRKRAPVVEIGLLLLLFTAARQQTWYALNLIPALLLPQRWALGIFLGCTLASQAIQRKNFIGGWDAPPFLPFLLLAIALSAGLAFAYEALGAPGRARVRLPEATIPAELPERGR
jgi:Glycosyltransferase family 87